MQEKGDMENFVPEFFDPDFYCCIDIVDRPSRYLGSDRYLDWLSKVFLLFSLLANYLAWVWGGEK